MNDTKITIERTSDYEVLSSFFCGVRELDQLIHKKENGLRSFIEDEDNHMYVVKKEEAPIALFVEHTALVETENFNTLAKEIDFIAVRQDLRNQGIGRIILEQIEKFAARNNIFLLQVGAFFNKKYSAVGFYEKCGFQLNGPKQGNIQPMIKEI